MKELYIDRGITQSRAAVYIDGEMTELYTENHDDESLTGNIYKGRIENLVPGLNAAFVNIGTGKNAILHFKDNTSISNYKRGIEILVQVIREASGDKGSRVSEEISLPGKYIVLLPKFNHIYISNKIKDEDTIDRLYNIAKNIEGNGYGIIFRTEAEKIDDEVILEEYFYLKNLWDITSKRFEFIKPPELVFDSRSFLNYVVREYLKSDIDKVYVNRKEDIDFIFEVLNQHIGVNRDLIQYSEQDFRFINTLSNNMLKNLDKKTLLPSGGYLYIESTEALTTIDVNTGSFTGELNKEETILKTNEEACLEIFKMIKLLNLSGIIIIDFINMKSNKNNQIIRDYIRELFKNDRVQNSIYDFTHLGLLEMSRAKKGKKLVNIIYENESKGNYNISYILKEIENKCLRYSKHYNKQNFNIYAPQSLLEEVNSLNSSFILDMKNIYGIGLNFIKSNSIKDYIIDRDLKAEPVAILIGDKKLTGELIDYKEDGTENITIRIKKH